MPLKSVIDIPVNDKEFQRFVALFEKYQSGLKEMPAFWEKMNKAQGAHLSAWEKTLVVLFGANEVREAAQQNVERHLTTSERLWSSMAGSAKAVAGSVLSITGTLLKSVGVLGGLGAAGGLWGIDKLAHSAADQRRAAMGLGLTTGDLSAFRINFSRVIDPDSFLGQLNEMEADISKQGPAWALMHHGLTGNTGNDALALLREMRALAQRTPTNQLSTIFGAYGLPNDPENLRRLQSMSEGEFSGLVAGYQRDRSGLNVSDATGRAWTNFTNQLERAEHQIFKTFVEGLTPLEKPLEHLSEGASKFIATMAHSDLVKNAIDHLAHWLDNFSGVLSKPAFLDKVEQFTSDVGLLADALHKVTHLDETGRNVWGEAQNWTAKHWPFANPLPRIFASAEQQYGLPRGLLSAINQKEAGGNYYAPDHRNTNGTVDYGPFQINSSWGIDPALLRDPQSAAKIAATILKSELAHYKGDVLEAILAYHTGEKYLDPIVKAHPQDWRDYINKDAQHYLAGIQVPKTGGVEIVVINNTGGSAAVTASMFGAPLVVP